MDFLWERYDGAGILDRTAKYFTTPNKKRFSTLGQNILIRKNLVDEKKLNQLDDSKEYNERVHVFDIIKPNQLVVHFGKILHPRGEPMTQLMYSLMEKWKQTPGFGLTHNVPGEGVVSVICGHVIAAVESHLYPEDAVLLARMEGHPEQVQVEEVSSENVVREMEPGSSGLDGTGMEFLTQQLSAVALGDQDKRIPFRTYIYLRGVITEVKAGFDKFSARYRVFLYDKGIFGEFTVNNMAPLPTECFQMVRPQYCVLKIPGLRPLGIKRVTVDLYSGKQSYVAVSRDTWRGTAMKLARKLLLDQSRLFTVEVLGDQGEYLFGDIQFEDKDQGVDAEKCVTELSAESGKKKSYRDYMVRKRIAYCDEEAYFDELLKDAEDEEKGDWRQDARTWF